MKPNEFKALRLLDAYTAGHLNFWSLAGGAKASVRAHVMSELNGVRTPQSKSSVNALRDAFFKLAKLEGDCIATCEEAFEQWAKEMLKNPSV